MIHSSDDTPGGLPMQQLQAELARPRLNSEPHAGLPAMLIAISGVYQGSDAPDNRVSIPPPTDQ